MIRLRDRIGDRVTESESGFMLRLVWVSIRTVVRVRVRGRVRVRVRVRVARIRDS
jgi:hypothetical protein